MIPENGGMNDRAKGRKSVLGLPRRDLKAVIPVHPSGLRGYTGRGLLPPHF